MEMRNEKHYQDVTASLAIYKVDKQRKRNNQKESMEQQAIFEWANYNRNRYPELDVLYAIPNGGKRDVVTAAHLKKEGVKSGVSDMHLPVPSGKYIGLWIELKVKPNKATESQLEWIAKMNRYGHKACVAYGADEAIKLIKEYLSNRD